MPTRTKPKTDLLSKFDSIKVEPVLKIPAEALELCKKYQVQFEKAIASLDMSKVALERMKEEQDLPDLLETTRRYNGEISIDRDFNKARLIRADDTFGIFRYYPDYGLNEIKKLVASAEDTLATVIIDYFNGKYNLELKKPTEFWRNERNVQEYKLAPSYQNVVNWILDECGGFDFADVGFENLRKEFRKDVGNLANITVGTKKITIENFIYVHKDYRGRYTWGSSGAEQMARLCKYITFYEVGELADQIFGLEIASNDEPELAKPIELESTSKIKNIRVFKNKKIEIRFNESGQEQEFYDTFEFYKR